MKKILQLALANLIYFSTVSNAIQLERSQPNNPEEWEEYER